MLGFITLVFAALLTPVMLFALGIWLVFAIIGLILKAIGWTFRIAFKAFGWLFIITLVLGLFNLPYLAILSAIAAVVMGFANTVRA